MSGTFSLFTCRSHCPEYFRHILNVLIDYDLRNRVIVVMLDNASANNIAIEILGPLVSGFHDELATLLT